MMGRKAKGIIPDERIGKTINFEKPVLKAIEERARISGSSVSTLVNGVCRSLILSDEEYYRYMAKEHLKAFHEANYMKEQMETAKLING